LVVTAGDPSLAVADHLRLLIPVGWRPAGLALVAALVHPTCVVAKPSPVGILRILIRRNEGLERVLGLKSR